ETTRKCFSLRLFEVRACGFPQALTLIGCSFVKELSGPAGAASCSEVANYTHPTITRQHPTSQKPAPIRHPPVSKRNSRQKTPPTPAQRANAACSPGSSTVSST
ncbi:hypothetical protein, partial [Laribacter hongkongensis]|uniref:hypothetical protein n=1 Tax=Laribacter hongkongensis TaxID=168471 RepID=UPI001EFDCA46